MNHLLKLGALLIALAWVDSFHSGCVAQTLPSTAQSVIRSQDYGAAGDGVTPDDTAFDKALTAALGTKGPVTVQFEAGKIYRIETIAPSTRHANISERSGLTIDGQGATLLLKGNRIGPVIEGCYFEAMLDDAINVGMMLEVSPKIMSPTNFILRSTSHGNSSPVLRAGDHLDAYDLNAGRQLANANPITAVRVLAKTGRLREVSVRDRIGGMVAVESKWRNAGGKNLADAQPRLHNPHEPTLFYRDNRILSPMAACGHRAGG